MWFCLMYFHNLSSIPFWSALNPKGWEKCERSNICIVFVEWPNKKRKLYCAAKKKVSLPKRNICGWKSSRSWINWRIVMLAYNVPNEPIISYSILDKNTLTFSNLNLVSMLRLKIIKNSTNCRWTWSGLIESCSCSNRTTIWWCCCCWVETVVGYLKIEKWLLLTWVFRGRNTVRGLDTKKGV